jgi:hypothetical protein
MTKQKTQTQIEEIRGQAKHLVARLDQAKTFSQAHAALIQFMTNLQEAGTLGNGDLARLFQDSLKRRGCYFHLPDCFLRNVSPVNEAGIASD